MVFLKRLFNKPKDLMPGFMPFYYWVLYGVVDSVWVYGVLNNIRARKHRITGQAQFVLWKKGDQKEVDGIGHLEDKWHNFGDGWSDRFTPFKETQGPI